MSFRLYRQPQSDELTVIGADPADGGDDYCAAVAKSKKHNDTFMELHARMDSSQFGYELAKFGKFVKNKTRHYPIIGVERNTGMATLHVLTELNYPEIFRMPKLANETPEKQEEPKLGWVTTAPSRRMMLDELALSMKQKINIIPSRWTVDEMVKFIVTKSGKPEAAPGAHDDLVMAEAIAWQLIKLTPHTVQEEVQATIAAFPKFETDEFGIPA